MIFIMQSLWTGLNLLAFKIAPFPKAFMIDVTAADAFVQKRWTMCLSPWASVDEIFSCCLLPHSWFSPCTPSSLDSVGPYKWPQALLLLATLAGPEDQQGRWGVSNQVEMGGLVPSFHEEEQGCLPSLHARGSSISNPGWLFTGLCETVAGSTGSCLEPCLHRGSCFLYQWRSCIGIFLA